MAKIVQLHRMVGSLAATYVGPQGEVIGDLGANSLRYQDGATPGGFLLMQGGNNLAELTNIPQARTALGLGSAAESNVADFAAEAEFDFVFSGDGAALTGAVSYLLPKGFILKSGFAVPNPGIVVNFPVAFPNNILGCGATMMESTSGGGASRSCDAYPLSKTQMQITSNIGGGGFQACWFAWGR